MADAYNLNSFRDKHAGLIERHESFLADKAYAVTDKLAQTVLDCVRLIMSRPEHERTDNFLHAFILLASKVVSHLEGARTLLNVGRYGDVAVVIRGLFSDVMTAQYLSLYPADSPAWLKLAAAR